MYKRGEVVEVSAARHQVRVRFPASDDVTSPWLDVLRGSTLGRREFGLPRVGNQVACLLDQHGESGCVLGAVYSQVDPVPEGATDDQVIIEFGDGARLVYSEAQHKITVDLPSGGIAALCGEAMKIALAELVADWGSEFKSIFDGHSHVAGALAGGGPSPITGSTGAPTSSAPEPPDFGAAQLRSA